MRRRYLMVLEQRIQEPDATTGITDSYAEVVEVWGALAAMGAAMHIGDAQISMEATHRAVIKWHDPTTWTHLSARGGAQRFRKLSARDPDNSRRVLEVMLEEIQPEIA